MTDRTTYMREYKRRWRQDPGNREYARRWQAAYRARGKPLPDGAIGALHDLGCTRERCRCKRIPIYRRAAA